MGDWGCRASTRRRNGGAAFQEPVRVKPTGRGEGGRHVRKAEARHRRRVRRCAAPPTGRVLRCLRRRGTSRPAGTRPAGSRRARRVRGAPRLRQERSRRLLHGRLSARAGPAVSDGPEPAPGERHARRAPRTGGPRQRRAAANARLVARGGEVTRSALAGRRRCLAGIRRRGERVGHDPSAAVRVRSARADDVHAVDCPRQCRRHEAARLRALLRPRRRLQHAAPDRLSDGRRRPRLQRPRAVPGRRDARGAVRARAVDLAGRDVGAAERARPPCLVELVPRGFHPCTGESGPEGRCGSRNRDRAAERHRLERMGGVGLEVRQRTSDGCERPAPGAPLTVDVLRGRSRRLSAGLAEALRRDVSGRAVDRARDERAHRVGLDREPDRRDRRLPGNRRLDAERVCDALQGQPRTAADHPGELPGQPGRERDAERRRGGAAEPGRAPCDARRAEARTADRAQPQRPVHRLLRDAGTRFLP